jgi:hypothetical protein
MDGLNARSREAEDEPFAPQNAFQHNVFEGPNLQIAPRSELAIRRFTEFCRNKNWGSLLYHKVGTGKTIASLLIALNYISGNRDKKIIVVAPPGLFSNFRKDLREAIGLGEKLGRLVDYPYPELIEDINLKNYDKLKVFDGNIAIFDEAHRLLSDVIHTSSESGNDSNRHCLVVDTPFQHAVYKAERCILLTGTPVQKNFADICRIMNFLKRTNTFDVHTYAQKTSEQFRKKKLLELARIALGAIRKKGIATTLAQTFIPGLQVAGGEGVVDMIYGLLISAGLPLNVVGAIKVADDILIDTLLANVQDATETLDENIYDISKLAEDSKDCISLYDYEIQKEYINLPEFLKSLKRDRKIPLFKFGTGEPFEQAYPPGGQSNLPEAIRATLPTEPPPPNLSFPEKLVTLSIKTYSKFQYDLLSRMYMGLLEDIEKDIFYIDQYLGSNSASNSSIRLNRTRAAVIGRVIGNLGEDIYQYTTTLEDEKRKYTAVQRIDGAAYRRDGPVFTCDKFEEMLACIKRSATGETVVSSYTDDFEEIPIENSGIPYAVTKIRNDTTYPHPHRGPGGSVYLPIVYSFTEELGTSLFAAYLDSLGYSYVLIHQDQKKEVLEQQIDKATRRTYPVLERGTELPKSSGRPICAILHPKMTEGINCTYNPEIILMDVCNTYGDMEQVHGRVLRRYNPRDVEGIKTDARRRGEQARPVIKIVRQMIADSKSDDAAVRNGRVNIVAEAGRGILGGFKRIGQVLGYAKKKLFNVPGQKFFYEVGDFKSWLLKFRCESPDLNGLRRLLKEEEYLEDFTKRLIENDAATILTECAPRDVCSNSNIKEGKCAKALNTIDMPRRTYKIRYRNLEGLRPVTGQLVFSKGTEYLVKGDEGLQEALSGLATRPPRNGCGPLGCLRRRRGGNTVSKRPNTRNGNAARTNTRRKKND